MYKLASITNTASGSPVIYASYTYDALGQLTIEDTQDPAQKKYIRYDVTGKVTTVARDVAFDDLVVEYVYNELGQRIIKKLYNSSYEEIQRTYYVGGVIYTQPVTTGTLGTATAQEYQIDGGSGRIGIYYRQSGIYAYQLTDHLGNVRAVVAKNSGTLEVRLYNDYYPYGMVIPPVNAGSNDYRYGYQGQYAEKDPETDWNAFELRMYDSRIARWLSVDPKKQFHSPYVAMGNNPVTGVDKDGGETKSTIINEKGKVVGGKLDGDFGIYMVDGLTRETFNVNMIDSYKSHGEFIGISLFETSFYVSESRQWRGQLDIGSYAARDWLGQKIYTNTPSDTKYISAFSDYNYKDIGLSNVVDPTDYRYRGSQISEGVYASGRDVGNIGAGYVSGFSGNGWRESLLAFRIKEGLQNHQLYKKKL
jgi:RHS repeat-associated protein